MIVKTVIEEIRAIVRGINDLRLFFRERRDKQAQVLTGKWTNEGDVIAMSPSHFIDLELLIKGNKVSGVVCSRALGSGSKLPNGSIIGKKSWRGIKAEVVDVQQGRLVKFGKVTLEFKKGYIFWKCKDCLADFLPRSAQLWKLEGSEVR